jgi:hypothetical protein
VLQGTKIPEMPVSSVIGSMPQVPTFWVFGTSAPMMIPSGMIASVPRTRTPATVSQPPAPPAMTSSKSRRPGISTASTSGRIPPLRATSWLVKYARTPCGMAL